jgi:hypothetical protein
VHSIQTQTMISFIVIIGIYLQLVHKFFNRSVGPMCKRMQLNLIQFPKEYVGIWILVSGVLFPMTSVIKARESNWDQTSSLSAMAPILGLILGMIVDV